MDCKNCGSKIWWDQNKNGKWTPRNPDGSSHFKNCSRKKRLHRELVRASIEAQAPEERLT